MTFERNGEIQIDLAIRRIRVLSRFMVKEVSGIPGTDGLTCACTGDCGGGGYLEFETEELPAGTYAVELGTKLIGELSIPLLTTTSLCLSTD
jgi:hypothetical protein